jgi:two-component system LytT family response regulator
MTTLRTLLIDDERAARERLLRMLSAQTAVEIIGEARDGLEAVQLIEELEPDLILLDVQMPGLDGFEVLQSLAPPTRFPLVIFVTGFDEYALRAFQAQALAYLLKPVEQEQLDAMIKRASSIHGFQELRAEQEGQMRGALARAAPKLDRIVGRKANRLLLLDPAEICFFYLDTGILRARTATQSYSVNYTLGALTEALNGRNFFRAHRSALVNLDHVAEIRPDVRSSFELVMKDDSRTVIEVSERQGRALRALVPGL